MKVIELIQEIEDILETAGGFPLTGKVMVDPEEIRDILKEIKQELPEEIQQAQWIKNERQRILDDAKVEYDRVISAANEKADELVETDDITLRAKKRADEIMRATEANVKDLKLGTFNYIDDVLGSFQGKMADLNETYAQHIFNEINDMFAKIDDTINQNRDEIRGLSYRTEEEG
ncbi:MAG: ATPase [Clostridia bacterium]|nr:ATPase [Clostridia bacterium]